MVGRFLIRLRQLPALAGVVAAPGLIVVAALAGSKVLAVKPALIAGGAVVLLAALVAGPYAMGLARARDAVGALGTDGSLRTAMSPRLPRSLGPGVGELWLAILRLARVWRERLARAEARAAAADAVIAAVPDPLILLDDRRRIVRANAAAADFAGTGPAADPFARANPAPRDLAAFLRNPAVLAAADAVLRRETARVVEFAVTAPVERQWRARFARIDQPSVDGAVAVLTLHDITELKRAEQMRADFIANASHELRTPLATLTGFVETLLGPAREDAEARERFLAIMLTQASRMSRLVEDLLSLSRIELNEHVMPRDRVALAPLLGHLADAFQLRAGERGVQLRLRVPDDLPDVLGDRDELIQIFQNLLDNAIKYGRAGTEVAVAAQIVQRPPASGERGQTRFVAVAVQDRGDGIAREHLTRLTERFYRVDTARSREMGGTGLGLAIVKHILNRHRGFLDITSTLGVGSVFTVRLRPHADASPKAADDA